MLGSHEAPLGILQSIPREKELALGISYGRDSAVHSNFWVPRPHFPAAFADLWDHVTEL